MARDGLCEAASPSNRGSGRSTPATLVGVVKQHPIPTATGARNIRINVFKSSDLR